MRWACLAVAPLVLVAAGAGRAQSSVLVGGAVAGSARVGARAQVPLIGADLVNTDPLPPHCWNGSIVPDYGQPGVRARMQDDLAAMRAAGLQTFRIFLDRKSTRLNSSHGSI